MDNFCRVFRTKGKQQIVSKLCACDKTLYNLRKKRNVKQQGKKQNKKNCSITIK